MGRERGEQWEGREVRGKGGTIVYRKPDDRNCSRFSNRAGSVSRELETRSRRCTSSDLFRRAL